MHLLLHRNLAISGSKIHLINKHLKETKGVLDKSTLRKAWNILLVTKLNCVKIRRTTEFETAPLKIC